MKWLEKEVKEKLCGNTFREHSLEGMIVTVFVGHPFEALNATYPGLYKLEEMKKIFKVKGN